MFGIEPARCTRLRNACSSASRLVIRADRFTSCPVTSWPCTCWLSTLPSIATSSISAVKREAGTLTTRLAVGAWLSSKALVESATKPPWLAASLVTASKLASNRPFRTESTIVAVSMMSGLLGGDESVELARARPVRHVGGGSGDLLSGGNEARCVADALAEGAANLRREHPAEHAHPEQDHDEGHCYNHSRSAAHRHRHLSDPNDTARPPQTAPANGFDARALGPVPFGVCTPPVALGITHASRRSIPTARTRYSSLPPAKAAGRPSRCCSARHHDRLHGLCRRLLGNDQDAQDATQEALIADRPRTPRLSTVAAPSRPGPTGSPRTPPWTNCAAAIGGRSRDCARHQDRDEPAEQARMAASVPAATGSDPGDARDRPPRRRRGAAAPAARPADGRRAARSPRPRLRGDRRGACHPHRHRAVAHRPRAQRRRRPARHGRGSERHRGAHGPRATGGPAKGTRRHLCDVKATRSHDRAHTGAPRWCPRSP